MIYGFLLRHEKCFFIFQWKFTCIIYFSQQILLMKFTLCGVKNLTENSFHKKDEFIWTLRYGGWKYFMSVIQECSLIHWFKGILNLQRQLFFCLLLFKCRDVWSPNFKKNLTHGIRSTVLYFLLIAKFKGGSISKYSNWLNVFFSSWVSFRNYWQSKTYSRLWDMALLFSN